MHVMVKGRHLSSSLADYQDVAQHDVHLKDILIGLVLMFPNQGHWKGPGILGPGILEVGLQQHDYRRRNCARSGTNHVGSRFSEELVCFVVSYQTVAAVKA